MLSGLQLALMTLFTLSASAQPDKNYLCFTANTDNSTVALSKTEGQTEVSLEYSTDDGEEWLAYTIGTAVTLNDAGDKVYFRNVGTAETFSTANDIYNFFTMTGSIAASGNVMSLVDQSCKTTTIPCDYCFCKLFLDCTALTAAPELPATTLAERCYYYMFQDCTALTTAPELPATTLEVSCYHSMFNGCSALTTAPKLPATTLANICYGNMFNGCSALTTAPELPATELKTGCYNNMFNGCSTLTTAPELPATELYMNCYNSMFNGCSALTTAPELPATTLANQCYSNMFNGCEKLNDIKVAFTVWKPTNATTKWVTSVPTTGTFSCPEGLEQTTGESGIPEGWTVKNTYDLAITSETGWASMCVNLPLIVPTGVDVYYASAVEGSTITLTQIPANTVMAAKTAVIVKGAKGTVSFPISGATATSYPGNLFQGSSVAKPCNARENYVLNASKSTDEKVHFSIYTGTTLSGHKAWLPMSAVGGANSIQFRFGDATAISTVETEVAEDVIYNLAGQRVGSDYRGLVIKNGKKILKR